MTTSPNHAAQDARLHLQLRRGAGAWRLAPAGSEVAFKATTYWGLKTVAGRFREVAAEAKVDTNGRVTADLRIDVSSVDTGNARRDKHLRSEDFLDVDTFPSLLVVVDHVEPTGPTQALVCAHLCIAGTVLPIELEATIESGRTLSWAEVSVSVEIDRAAFGLTYNKLRMLGRHVRVDALLRFVKAPYG